MEWHLGPDRARPRRWESSLHRSWQTLTPDTPTEVEFLFRASAGVSSGFDCAADPVVARMDLGTEDRYVRMLGVTQAWSGGVPDDIFTIDSERDHDYGVARPLVESIPEPASAALGAAALTALAILRRRSQNGTAPDRAQADSEEVG